MGVVEVNQIAKHLENEYKVLLPDITSVNEHARSSALSKSLALYSIKLLYPESTKSEVLKCLVDGGDDNGIDLIYHDKDQSELCFVQAKFNKKGNSEPELQEVKTFLNGISDIIELKFDKFNKLVRDREKEITDLLMSSSVRLRAVLVHTAPQLAEHAMREFRDFKDEQNIIRELFDFNIIGQKRLYGSLIGLGEEINIDAPLVHWGMTETEPFAYYGQLSADALADMWLTYDNSLFSSNLRKGLGTTDINNEMNKTLEVEPQNFWYFNNGITFICDNVEKKAAYGVSTTAGLFECKNVSIVNGAQTVSTIGKFKLDNPNSKNLENAFVNVRIIPTEKLAEDTGEIYNDHIFSKRITITNNRQNEVKQRDFIALQSIQQKIRDQLLIEGITYFLERQELEESSSQSFTVDEATRSLAYNSDIDSTFLVRTNIGQIYEDFEHARYKKLYNSSVTGIFVWNCVLIKREIEKIINLLSDREIANKRATIRYSKGVISKVVFDLINKEKNIKQIHYVLDGNFSRDLQIESKVSEVVDKLVQSNVIEDSGKTLPNFFKSPNEVRSLYAYLSSDLGNKIEEEVQFDVTELQDLDSIQKRQLENFYDKISEDKAATNVFLHLFKKIYNKDIYDFSYLSNIHLYDRRVVSDKSTERFLMRIAYFTKMIISFDIVKFEKFTSVLLENPEKASIIKEETNGTLKIIINDEADAKRAIKLLSSVL